MEGRTDHSSGDDARSEAEKALSAGSGDQRPAHTAGYKISKHRLTARASSPSHTDGPRTSRDRSEAASPSQNGTMPPPRNVNAAMAGHMGAAAQDLEIHLAGSQYAAQGALPAQLQHIELTDHPTYQFMMNRLTLQQQQQQMQQQLPMLAAAAADAAADAAAYGAAATDVYAHAWHTSLLRWVPTLGWLWPPRPGGPCITSSAPSAPLSWREGEGHPATDTYAEELTDITKELKAAAANWHCLDVHPQLMDSTTMPPGNEGLPYTDGQRMFASATLPDDKIFVGTQGCGRWAHSKVSVTVYVSDRQNKTQYSKSEVRESIAAEIQSLSGFDGECISEGGPCQGLPGQQPDSHGRHQELLLPSHLP